MSPNQQRKWTSAKKRAVEILIERSGDKALHELSRDDALSYVDWWEDRVLDEGISSGTANKSISHVGGMIRQVNKRGKLGLDNVFAGTRLEGGKDGSRSPFKVEFIRDVILAEGALAALNDEARDVVYIAMETGARSSEIVNLSRQQIMLDADIPFIRIEAEDRLLKTEHSKRDVPLVGMALEAMRRHPDGFPRYVDKGDNFSAAAMKHFRKHKLLPTKKHSINSFRHYSSPASDSTAILRRPRTPSLSPCPGPEVSSTVSACGSTNASTCSSAGAARESLRSLKACDTCSSLRPRATRQSACMTA
jgi:integrase